jgi:energy-converting hydrogenase Eha subunit B
MDRKAFLQRAGVVLASAFALPKVLHAAATATPRVIRDQRMAISESITVGRDTIIVGNVIECRDGASISVTDGGIFANNVVWSPDGEDRTLVFATGKFHMDGNVIRGHLHY